MKRMAIAIGLAVLGGIAPVRVLAQDKPAEAVKPAAAKSSDAHTYRLLYTLTEMDGGKRVGVQHYSMTVEAGNQAAQSIRISSKVPVCLGISELNAGKPYCGQSQFFDVSLRIDARLASDLELAGGMEQSSFAEVPDASIHQPVIRTTQLENRAFLTPGKPMLLGSLDTPGSTRHLDVEVVLERLPGQDPSK